MKKCIHCGKELPDGASFCPYCETVQGKTVKEDVPKPREKKLPFILAALVVLVAILLVHHVNAPKVIDAKGPELVYGNYRLILATAESDDKTVPEPQEYSVNTLAIVDNAATPSLLFAARETDGENRCEVFLALVDTAEVETVPRDGADQMYCREPQHDSRCPSAVLMTDIGYWPSCGTNDVCWTLHMKNGDTLRLQQNYTCLQTDCAIFTPEDAPMDTIADLQALIERIDKELPPNLPVYLFLPAATYEGDLTFENRTYALIGSEENGKITGFNGTITVKATGPEKQRIVQLRFLGENSGIEAYARVMVSHSEFSGLQTGITVHDGAYIDPHQTRFENCDTAILYDCNESPYNITLELDHCEFLGNRIGLHIKAIDGGEAVNCNGCFFSGNETDILNETDVFVDTGGATFE